ncbi:MAG: IS66 family insertion sequence element accessory protein TnpA, partial [Candidatus Izemoplasmataceae bacterium]
MDLEKNRKRWKKLLADHQDSGKSIKQFCLEHDVKVHQF